MASTLRFLRHYLRPQQGAILTREVEYRREDDALPARLYLPAGRRAPLPAWVVLHGLTCLGLRHPSLDRFAQALAAGGAAVLVPEIPEWRRLVVAPGATAPSVAGAIDALLALGVADPERIGAFGFSFGATQLLGASTDPRLAGKIRGIAAWGGYYDLHDLYRFGLTGEFESDGVLHRTRPDPYGGWVMGANYLTGIPGQEGADDVAAALRRLAMVSGERGEKGWGPDYDPLKHELRAALPRERRETFDLFAPLSGQPAPDAETARRLTRDLADAALRADPLLDPRPHIPAVRTRTIIAHGKDDRLVPYTEGLRLGRALGREWCAGCTITSLFAHSGGTDGGTGRWGLPYEAARFIHLLQRIQALV